MNNKGTSLLELLLVIVIIALLLKVSIPKIIGTKEVNDTINNVVNEVDENPTTDDNTSNESGINAVKMAGIRDSAIMIARLAETNYSTQVLLGNESSIECSDIARISDDYEYCKVDYDENGVANVSIKGKANGRFSNIICSGTKGNMNCTK